MPAAYILCAIGIPQSQGPRVIDPSRFPDRGFGALAQLSNAQLRGSDANNRNVEDTALRHRIERGEDLLVGKIARDAEQHQRVGPGRSAVSLVHGARECAMAGVAFGSV